MPKLTKDLSLPVWHPEPFCFDKTRRILVVVDISAGYGFQTWPRAQ